MPDKRTHRGANPEELEAFGTAAMEPLRQAEADLSWLLSRGYAHRSGIKLVGDRYELTARQRLGVLRCACSERDLAERRSREIALSGVAGQTLLIDGFNLLTTVESALGGGVVLIGRDGCCRDMASLNGHFKRVFETAPALGLVGECLERVQPAGTIWYLDRPVSNSGRLADLIRRTGAERGWNWKVVLVPNPDPVLSQASGIVATADSAILEACLRWVNLAWEVVRIFVPDAWVVRLGSAPPSV